MSGLVFSEAREADAWFELQHVDTQNLLLARSLCRFLSDYRYSTEASDEKILEALKGILNLSTKTMFTDHTIVATTPTYASFSNIAISQKFVRNLDDYYDRQREALAAATDDAIHISSDLRTPVWGSREPTPAMENFHRRLLEEWDERAEWTFWLRFYDGMWNGTFDEWDLALEVIQIDEAIWEKGVKGVAAEIEKIEARLELQARISELELAVLEEHSQQRGIGDNFPPEPIDDIAIVPSDLQPLWEPLLSIKAETHAEVPDVKRVQKAISVLIGIASACGSWAWEKANIFINAGLKTAGAATGTALLAHLAGHGDKIALVIDAALRWFGLLP